MGTAFHSANWRAIWLGVVVNYATDAFVIYVVSNMLGAHETAVWWAGLLPIAGYVCRNVVAFYYFAKRLLWFYLFEKDGLVLAIMAELSRLRMPTPSAFYNDIDDYLTEAAFSETMSKESRLLAGITLGVLQAQRQFGPRAEAWVTTVAFEAALLRIAAGKTDEPA